MKPAVNKRKLRGGYYTPPLIAHFLARWAVQSPNDHVLEPSCGDGNVLEAAAQRLIACGQTEARVSGFLLGVELDREEAAKAFSRVSGLVPGQLAVHHGDFFTFCKERLESNSSHAFDAVLGNPPFIRYQSFPSEHRETAFSLMRRVGITPNRLTNSWAPFLVASALMLNANGRLAMVIPAELFQVKYAAGVRLFLSEFFERITLVTFKRLVFDGLQQEVVLLLAERDTRRDEGIRVVELTNAEELARYDPDVTRDGGLKPLDHSTDKWIQYFLNRDEILLLRRLAKIPNLPRLGHIASVDVGLVTGENKFFAITQEEAEEHSLEAFTQRLVSRSAQLEGLLFTDDDWESIRDKQMPALLFAPPNVGPAYLPTAAAAYVQQGERLGFNTGYKCRIRKRWYVVPSQWIPDAFVLRQVHGCPRLVLNRTTASCTDTIHRVRFKDRGHELAVAGAFMNSMTLAFAEVTGRSYGGGVLTFEPSEVEDLPIPLSGAEKLDVSLLDTAVRAGRAETVLDIVDELLLVGGMGLTPGETTALRSIWRKLRDRRINRK